MNDSKINSSLFAQEEEIPETPETPEVKEDLDALEAPETPADPEISETAKAFEVPEADEAPEAKKEPIKKDVKEAVEAKGNANVNPDDSEEIDFSNAEVKDDLENLKSDLGVDVDYIQDDLSNKFFKEDKENKENKKAVFESQGVLDLKGKGEKENSDNAGQSIKNDQVSIINEADPEKEEKLLGFDVGKEEKDLLGLAKFIENKIPEKEWKDIASVTKKDSYVVTDGDYLWKLSQKLFGSGFYYSKIWSLNPYITNPHEIKPGMVLVFDTGDADSMPTIQLGKFSSDDTDKAADQNNMDFANFGDDAEPAWIKEKKRLQSQGIYVQYATDKSYDDLDKASKISLIKEYEKYSPPNPNIIVDIPGDQYDATGFDKSTKINWNFKEGFYLNTFLTSNLVQDFGEVDSAKGGGMFLSRFDTIYVRFDSTVIVAPGDKYSIYSAAGKSEYSLSDRKGYKYTIVGQIQVIRKISDVWECMILESASLIQRKDRITVYTPKIEKITRTFNQRNIEGMIVDNFASQKSKFSYGDVIFIDRGRADGVEMGNIFEIFSQTDQATGKQITPDPTYKIGEITVITLTDNFATALVTLSKEVINLGDLVFSKTAENAALASRVKNKTATKEVQYLENKAVDELDVELNLEDINEDLLKKADKIELTEDEMEELEKQEREKSIVQKGEKNLKELEKLEKEIESAESQLNAAKVDEDKNLEQQDLNFIEKKGRADAKDLFDALNDVEKKEGKKYLDEDINAKENPFGLTEFDLEEIDELLNTTSK